MNKKILIVFSILVVLVAGGVVGFLVLNNKSPIISQIVPPAPLPDKSPEFANDLINAFNTATTSIDLPEESVFMVTAYAGDESEPEDIDFASDDGSTKQFYMASTIKPLFAAAYINILEIKDLDYKVPLKFSKGDKTMETIAHNIADKINYNYDEDVLLDLFILPFFKDYEETTYEEVYEVLTTKEEIVNFEYTLRDVIKYTLGPSSNLGLTLLKHDLALKKDITEEVACNLVEEYLNNMLIEEGLTGSIVINKSTKSKVQKTLNTAKFEEIEYLFDWFYKNQFNLDTEIFNSMKEAMKEVGTDTVRFNRRHETKSIANKFLAVGEFDIIEKSGYIGFDYEAAPKLNEINGWDTLPPQDGKRIVFFTTSAFARIYLNTGKFVQYNFSVAVPFYISLDPRYEELNGEYTSEKNKILDSLEVNIQEVLEKYRDYIIVK